MILWAAIAGLALATIALVLNHDGGTVLGLANERFAQAVALIAIGVVIAGSLAWRLRGQAGTAVKMAAVWVLIAAGLVVGYSLRDDGGRLLDRVMSELVPGWTVTREDRAVAVARAGNGHFVVDADVNGTNVTMMLDTGASTVVLTPDDARRAGLDPSNLDYSAPVWTANGRTTAAPVTIERIAVGSIVVERVRAVVSQEGALRESLLGMSFLDRLSGWRVEGDRLVLGNGPLR